MKPRTKKFLQVGLGTTLVVIVVGFIFVRVVLFPRFEQFVLVENIKGEWSYIRSFKEKENRYPDSLAEVQTYFQHTPSEDLIYSKPRFPDEDEIILIMKQNSILSNSIRIKESGVVQIAKTE